MAFSPPSDPRHIITPTKLNRLARTLLQSEIGLVWLTAEISNFVAAGSGHWYFTLKDNKAQVRAAMFKQANRYIRPLPKEGDKVLVRASVGLYESRGDFQLIVEHLEAEGEGQLKLAFEQLKNKLAQEGLFGTERKRALPDKVQKIGIITSDSGAALHDVLTVLARRSPDCEVIIYPSLVQGEQAAKSLRQALYTANQRNEVDVLLLTRGGGSIEDLWCFNDEGLARDIAQSSLVVVSAVGHEVDITISDYVADMRAPTPSAAAELLSIDKMTRLARVQENLSALTKQMHFILARARQQHKAARAQLSLLHPNRQLEQHAQRLDMLEIRLQNAMLSGLKQNQMRLHANSKRLARIQPNQWLKNKQALLQNQLAAMHQGWQTQQKNASQRLQMLVAHLQAISPLATLARGYSVTLQNNTVVTSTTNVDMEKPLVTKLPDGDIISVPQRIENKG